MTPLVFDFPEPSLLGQQVRANLKGEEGKIHVKSFPDGESYLRIESPVEGREVLINATLFHPNEWVLNLLFLVDALRSQGAKRIGLLAPYLAYMRQDKIFYPGEALTSKTFARLLSASFDYLVTVDPHLHRYHDLQEIYSIPTTVIKSAPLISNWIHEHVENPFIIGPDGESAQWVEDIAQGITSLVLTKTRYKDGHVEIVCPQIEDIGSKAIVLVDDIISSGETLIHAFSLLKAQGAKPPLCIAIHPIFAENAYEQLVTAGLKDIITCNTIPHPTNHIDVTPLLVPALKGYMGLNLSIRPPVSS